MCKYVIVITVIARQDVDGHFGTTLTFQQACRVYIMSAILHITNWPVIVDFADYW